MRGLAAGIAIVLTGMRLSSAAEGQIDARTLCPVVIARSTVKMRRRCRNFSASCRTFLMSLMPMKGKGRTCAKGQTD